MTIPSPDQTWAHSTCSVAALTRALEDDSVTAIEADVILGTCVGPSCAGLDPAGPVPVMAHPPTRTSDLSLRSFLERSWGAGKHVKLDIKEGNAVLPVLDELRRATPPDADGPFVWLNADVLPGPGRRGRPGTVGRDALVGPYREYAAGDGTGRRAARTALSLGWNADCLAAGGYTEDDARAMGRTLRRHGLDDEGVVLAVNARALDKDRGALDGLMAAFPKSQALVWTGKGEPPISAGLQGRIRDHFDAAGWGERVGFDCSVASNAVTGLVFDAAVLIAGIVWTLARNATPGATINVAIAAIGICWTVKKYVLRKNACPPRKRRMCRRGAEHCKVVTKI